MSLSLAAEELAARLADQNVSVVVSLSRQSVASLAAAKGLTPQQTVGKLTSFLRSIGVKAVLDSGNGRDLALMEAAAEFLRRYRAAHNEKPGNLCPKLLPSHKELLMTRLCCDAVKYICRSFSGIKMLRWWERYALQTIAY
jgi:iron only hydrogenase large subunit-like protein